MKNNKLITLYKECLEFIIIVLCMLFFLTGSPISSAQQFQHDLFNKNSTTIDNIWFPLKPGTQYVYKGFTNEDNEKVPHEVITTVTDLTKVINNITTTVIFERDYQKNELVEAELAFFAQDKDGNVWELGQYSETYEKGEFIGGRAWLSGHLEGARAGIIMQANPRTGTPRYEEGFAPPPFNWTDSAEVYQTGQTVKVHSKTYNDVLVVKEFDKEEPKSIQLKYYAPNVGNIKVGWAGEDKLKENLDLFSVEQISPDDLAKIRHDALMLEEHAYVYARTPPAQPLK